jgi:hypothetical protein
MFPQQISHQLDIFHQMLFLGETTQFSFEKKVISEALAEFVRKSEVFSGIFMRKISEKIENGEIYKEKIVKILRIIAHMKIDSLNIENYRVFCMKVAKICRETKEIKYLAYFQGRLSLLTGVNLESSIEIIVKFAQNSDKFGKILEKLKRLREILNVNKRKIQKGGEYQVFNKIQEENCGFCSNFFKDFSEEKEEKIVQFIEEFFKLHRKVLDKSKGNEYCLFLVEFLFQMVRNS